MAKLELPALLGGPYAAPRLHVGDRTTCIVRDCEVIITSWTDAPIAWPRCRSLHQRGGSGLLVTEELARAVRTESALAIMAHWGVTEGVVWKWRKALGVDGHAGTPGSLLAITEAARQGAAAVQDREFTEEERQAKREIALQLDLVRHLREHPPTGRWAAEEVALFALDLTDAEIAARTGRTEHAVRLKRRKVKGE